MAEDGFNTLVVGRRDREDCAENLRTLEERGRGARYLRADRERIVGEALAGPLHLLSEKDREHIISAHGSGEPSFGTAHV